MTGADGDAVMDVGVETTPKKSGLWARMTGRTDDDASSASSTSTGKEAGPPPVPFFKLWKYTTGREKIMMVMGCIAAAVHGALMPLWTVIFGDLISAVADSDSDIVASIGGVAKWFFVLGAIAFVASYAQVQFQMAVATRTGIRMRKLYFRSLLRQDPAWYDSENSGELTSRVASDVDLIQAGMGDKVGSAVQFMAMSIVGFIIAFVYTWKLTLVILATTPIIGVSGALIAYITADTAKEGQGAYGGAGAIASEVISLIRTVHAFGGQEEEARRYEKKLDQAYKSGVGKGFYTGFGMGLMNFIMFSAFALAFWYGTKLTRQGEIDVTDVFVAFFSVLIGSMGLGQAAPSFNAFSVARGAAPRVYEIIDRNSEIDALSEDGAMPETVSGEVAFKNVTFNYRSRAEEGSAPVLRNLDLVVQAGTTHALVGASGCGKSSTMGLVERFYDADSGVVTLDGVDVRDLNVMWLRAQMGYVGQMPTLFRGTIRDNIALGAAVEFDANAKDGKLGMKREEVTDAQIISAAKLANAHAFISKLPEGYETKLGERGALLSGGQKQRICIARAVVRDPKILLLDEATSALDAQSERSVQEALERASEGRTTIVIAHRLSTVRNADVISVFKSGEITESGTHDELVLKEGGAYRELVELQQVRRESDEHVKDGSGEDETVQAASQAQATTMSITGVDSGVVGEDTDSDKEEEPDVDPGVVGRAFKINSGEWLYIVGGCFGALLSGASWPIMALVFSEVTAILADPNTEGRVAFWSLMFVVVGAVSLLGNVMQMGLLGVSGERLTRKLRKESFRALLRQEVGFFDREENSVGAVTTKLATEASKVKGLCGDTLGLAAVTISTIGVGVGVAFAGCWRVALIVLFLLPVMVLGGFLQMQMMTGFDSGSKKEYVRSGSIASEAVDNIRTITSLGVQDEFIERYDGALQDPLKNGVRASHVSGGAFGFAEGFSFAIWAIAFWSGAKFIEQGFCDFLGLMKAITALLFAGMNLGNTAVFAPDVAASKVAATQIFRLLDRMSSIDPTDESGVRMDNAAGAIDASDVEFEYPTRPDVAVLRGLSVSVQPGKTLALCGQSGCGKSTMVALLERFYDIRSGSLIVDATEVKDANLQSLRSRMALVQQEPDLFDRTVKENIAYGLSKEDGTPVTDDLIIQAAKAANAHDFVTNDLPLGYDTPVGERGGAMSGGMKQRIAIARALVRQPRVLLLDEATSALDARSERVVQDALDVARSGRTTVVVAHRLSTIKDADAIAVVAKGKIAEVGTHSELMRKGGAYAELVQFQMADEAGAA